MITRYCPPCAIPQLTGVMIAISEILLFGIGSSMALNTLPVTDIDLVSYYWVTFTILTAIWEISFICKYPTVCETARLLILNKRRVWTNRYSLTYILPHKLAIIFYAQYGAYADREYMCVTDRWSRLIESTHAIYCGLFSLIAMILNVTNDIDHSEIALAVSMGSQLMNSVLYMGQYVYQIYDISNPNYNCPDFPCGKVLSKRPFMYINILWTAMPTYVIIRLLI